MKTLEDYEKMGVFDELQMQEIWNGLEEGLDVSVYAKPEFDYNQMFEIRCGLEEGLDVSAYAKPEFHWTHMEWIRYAKNKGIYVSLDTHGVDTICKK